MSAGQKCRNELLVVAREPLYWREEFSPEEISSRGPGYIFNYPKNQGISSLNTAAKCFTLSFLYLNPNASFFL